MTNARSADQTAAVYRQSDNLHHIVFVDAIEMDYKAQLEQLLNEQLRKRDPNTSNVTVSFDGQFAIYCVSDRYQLRKLSPTARAFLQRGGDIVAVARSLFEG